MAKKIAPLGHKKLNNFTVFFSINHLFLHSYSYATLYYTESYGAGIMWTSTDILGSVTSRIRFVESINVILFFKKTLELYILSDRSRVDSVLQSLHTE